MAERHRGQLKPRAERSGVVPPPAHTSARPAGVRLPDGDAPFWTGTPVCVLGGTGFLGRHIVGQLLDAGAVV